MMERKVSVHRHKRTGAWVLNPVAGVRGGGFSYVIGFFRHLPVDASSIQLGELAISLLELASPLPDEASAFRLRDNPDPESQRVQRSSGLHYLSALQETRRYQVADVCASPRSKSWALTTWQYDWSYRGLLHGSWPPTRVKHSGGPVALGSALQALLTHALGEVKRAPPNPSLQRTRFARR